MSEMAEQVAEALRVFNDERDDYAPFNARLLAKVAIEAMREPTDAMIASGRKHLHCDSCISIYQAMIDAALKD